MNRKTATSPRRKPSQSRSRDTVSCILEAAAHILRQEGFEKATTNRIAERAGVSIGSLYQYFPNKQALLMALTHQHMAEMQAVIIAQLNQVATQSLENAIQAMVDCMLEAHAKDPELHRVLTEHAPEFMPREQIQQMEDGYIALVTAYLRQREGELQVQNIEMASFIVTHTLETLTHRAATQQSAHLNDPEFRIQVAALLKRYLL